jgi:dTMP kinase
VPDKFEAQPTTFFASVRSGYQARFEADPPRFARIAAEQNRETVWQDVMASVKQRGWLA